jgi:large subunit ribosomal protein L25
VRALPDSLPDHLEFDAEALAIGESVTVADLSAPEGVEIVTDPDTVVASVVAPSAVAVEEPAEEEAVEGAEPAAAAGSDEGEPSSD